MPANLENSAVATRLEKVSFRLNPKKSNAKEVEDEWCYEDLQDLLELIPKKMSFLSPGPGMQK